MSILSIGLAFFQAGRSSYTTISAEAVAAALPEHDPGRRRR
ncbi:MAG TPA: hypothetical protein VNW94_13105 [Streptosporangiaceae bacterium]|nr:hypothetical protein [Streptosporangiaceae bacterium]